MHSTVTLTRIIFEKVQAFIMYSLDRSYDLKWKVEWYSDRAYRRDRCAATSRRASDDKREDTIIGNSEIFQDKEKMEAETCRSTPKLAIQ